LRAEENPFSSFFHLFQRGKTTLSPKPRALRRRLKKIAYPVWISLVISARRLKNFRGFCWNFKKKSFPEGKRTAKRLSADFLRNLLLRELFRAAPRCSESL
jgi:hypothetical protein